MRSRSAERKEVFRLFYIIGRNLVDSEGSFVGFPERLVSVGFVGNVYPAYRLHPVVDECTEGARYVVGKEYDSAVLSFFPYFVDLFCEDLFGVLPAGRPALAEIVQKERRPRAVGVVEALKPSDV